jgi:hypothetical protein
VVSILYLRRDTRLSSMPSSVVAVPGMHILPRVLVLAEVDLPNDRCNDFSSRTMSFSTRYGDAPSLTPVEVSITTS